MTLSRIMTQPHYKSIVTLTNNFQRRNGLQQIHYRYALQENPDISEKYKKKMKRFFGKDLKNLFTLSDTFEKRGLPRKIHRKCIKKGTHLSFYLKQLVKKNILEREKGEDGKYRYVTKCVYDFIPVDALSKQIKEISPLALDLRGIKQFSAKSIDGVSGVHFFPYFIGLPDDFINPGGTLKKDFENALNDLAEGIFKFEGFISVARKFIFPPVLVHIIPQYKSA